MDRYLVLFVMITALAACGGQATPTPGLVATQIAVEKAAHATMTAEAPTATNTPMDTPKATATDTPTARATDTPTATATDTQTPTATDTPTATPSATRTPTATSAASPTATESPTSTPTPKPTARPAKATPKPKPTKAAAQPAKAPPLSKYRVVYTNFDGPSPQDYALWIVNGDGSGAQRIITRASEPSISDDGKRLLFYNWYGGLYIRDLHPVSAESDWGVVQNTSIHAANDENAGFPTWAPGGYEYAYFVIAWNPKIHVRSADGQYERILTPGQRPFWSSAGNFIAYDSCENNRCGIFRINPDGSGKGQLTMDQGGGANVSPDGSQIAYWSQADGDFEVYVVGVHDAVVRQLTSNRGNDALPAWSPDGKVIYYLSDRDGQGWALMVMNADGTDKRYLRDVTASSDPWRGWQYQRIAVTWNK